MAELLTGGAAVARTSRSEISALTERGTQANYVSEHPSEEDLSFIARVIRIAPDSVAAAALNSHQHLVAAFVDDSLAGFVIATVHAPENRELDWLFVDPPHHGSGIAAELMTAGMAWLGTDKPMWLNVVRHNERAIAFYRKFGFEIDATAHCGHPMPHWIMRRDPS
jgi:ribosomal protein S18 acetylase RimI-like enzyme